MGAVKRVKYDFARLQKYCFENGVTLIKNYESISLTKDVFIEGKCAVDGCEGVFNKKFCELVKSGGYCLKCKIKVSIERRKANCLEKYGTENVMKCQEVKNKFNSYKFTYEVLQNFCNENNITLIGNYENEKLHAHYKIQGRCISENCNNEFSKIFYNLYLRGGYCNSCTLIKAKEVRLDTNLKLYGVENLFQSDDAKEFSKKTCLEKYGVEYASQSLEIKNKFKNTCNQKYGVPHPLKSESVQDKIKTTNLKRYGFTSSMQSEIVKNKCKENCEKKYGVSHHMQVSEIAERCLKGCYRTKEYIFPSGKSRNIQGYEHFAIDEILKIENVPEENIIIGASNVPKIWYEDKLGKKHRHYVDIFIPIQNRCIEVKSTWTAEKGKDCIFLKQEAAKQLGYNYEIWVYNAKGEKVECHK
jgi:hypothetical protein